MTVREILVDWTLPSGSGKVSVFNFDAVHPVNTQRAALATFLNAIDGLMWQTVNWSIRGSGREFADASGTLTGAWAEPTVHSSNGTVSTGAALPDAAQVLVRWRTQEIVAGRFVQGRTFIPGLTTGAVLGGNLSSTPLTTISNAANALVDTALGLSVWHRPVNQAGGVLTEVSDAGVWGEFAVLRRRRG